MTVAPERESITELLRTLRALVADGKGVPLSASVMIPRDRALELIDRCLDASPREVTEAREILAERTQVLERTKAEAQQLLEEARRRAQVLVEQSEVVQAAQAGANSIRVQANEQANHLKRQTEDYIDRRLANFEIILSDLLDQTRRGRQRLADSSEPKAPETQSPGVQSPDDFFQTDEPGSPSGKNAGDDESGA
ncbi:ATP synthase F0 subunit B [Ferrimicrobium sp.]|uniref:ATP synthase F0 subunit B n=1 Tax=Ferrimicrobium sp. TaxID=2926050 RepID=UPI002637331B|nr:ATP synthase F0 subunit B [Ferrimicrobium sp.]